MSEVKKKKKNDKQPIWKKKNFRSWRLSINLDTNNGLGISLFCSYFILNVVPGCAFGGTTKKISLRDFKGRRRAGDLSIIEYWNNVFEHYYYVLKVVVHVTTQRKNM